MEATQTEIVPDSNRGLPSSRAREGRRKWQGRVLQRQDLAQPPVRPKKIVPLKVAEVVSAHTKASEPHILFASLIPQICLRSGKHRPLILVKLLVSSCKLLQTDTEAPPILNCFGMLFSAAVCCNLNTRFKYRTDFLLPAWRSSAVGEALPPSSFAQKKNVGFC